MKLGRFVRQNPECPIKFRGFKSNGGSQRHFRHSIVRLQKNIFRHIVTFPPHSFLYITEFRYALTRHLHTQLQTKSVRGMPVLNSFLYTQFTELLHYASHAFNRKAIFVTDILNFNRLADTDTNSTRLRRPLSPKHFATQTRHILGRRKPSFIIAREGAVITLIERALCLMIQYKSHVLRSNSTVNKP